MLTKAGWRYWFSVHLIGLLSILLRCNGFAEIQKGIVTQMASRPPNSDHDLFLVQGWLWEVLQNFFSVQPMRWLSLVVVYNPLFVACHNPIKKWFVVVSQHKRRPTLQNDDFFFLISGQFTRHALIKLFHFPNFLQMQKDHRMVDVEFFGNFSYSFKRISLNDGFQLLLSTSDGQPLGSSSSKLSCPLQNFLNHN